MGDGEKAADGDRGSSSRTVVKGVAWAALDNWIQQGVGLLTFIAIGGLVGPHLYGLMGMGMLYHILVCALVRDTFGEALIQRAELEREHLDTAFLSVTGLGAALMLVSWLLAPAVAHLFREPALTEIIKVLAVTFPIIAAANFYRSVLRRALNFKALAIRSAIANGIAAPVAIGLALKGAGIWSLLGYQLTLHSLDLVCVAFQSGWLPRLAFSRRHYDDISDFAYKTMGSFVLGNLGGQIDRFLIGYFLGAGALGIYGMARRIVDGIDQTVIGVINAVALPTFSRARREDGELARLLGDATHFSTLIACPVYAGLGLVAARLIGITLPPEWAPAAPVLTVLAGAGVFYPAILFLASCQRAVGRAGFVLIAAFATILLRIVLCLGALGLGYGMMGIVIGTVLSSVLVLPLRVYLARKALDLDVGAYLATMGPAFAATILMVLAVLAVDRGLDGLLPSLVILVAMVLTGVASYVGAIALLSPGSLRQMQATLLPARQPAASPEI